MKFDRFEDIIAWQESKKLTVLVYENFKFNKDYSFRDQIQRAAVSVMNNIAEGFERSGDKEFKKFLYIAKGSCGEVRSMLYLAIELRYISQDKFNLIYNQSYKISKMISGLIKVLK